MRLGDVQIYPQLIQEALDTFVITHTQRAIPHALRNLHLVTEYLQDNGLPPTQANRDYALKQILAATIKEEYFRIRRIMELPAQSPHNKSIALTYLQNDGRSDNNALLDYSVLFYRYVLADFGIGTEDLKRFLACDERSLRRYQKRGYARLAELLGHKEITSLQLQRVNRLKRHLRRYSTLLYGREWELKTLIEALRQEPRITLITGELGVGKTSLVASAIDSLISELSFNYLVWVDAQGADLPTIEQAIRQQLGIGVDIPLADALYFMRVFVVIEDIQIPPEMLLTTVNNAFALVLTSRKRLTWTRHGAHIHLNNLNEADSRKWIQRLLAKQLPAHNIGGLVERIARNSQGNPALIKLQVQNSSMGQSADYAARSITAHYKDLFHTIPLLLQKLWTLCAILDEGLLSINIIRVWPQDYQEAIHELESYMIFQWDAESEAYILHNLARWFIREQLYRHYASVEPIIRALIDEIIAHPPHWGYFDLSIVEAILASPLIIWDKGQYKQYVYALWEHYKRGNPVKWRAIFEKLLLENGDFEDEWLRVAYATCLRRLGEIGLAEEQLRYTIRRAGERGDFDAQLSALTEMAVCLRQQGRYTQSVQLLNELKERWASPKRSIILPEAIALELAQIAIDIGDGDTAIAYLEGVGFSHQAQLLRCEAYLLKNQYQHCKTIAEALLEASSNDTATESRAHTLLGRQAKEQGDIEKALDHFSTALLLLLQSNDVVAIARARSNLGAILIQLNMHHEAQHLLQLAHDAQNRLRDVVGIHTTSHNLRILYQALANQRSSIDDEYDGL